MIITNIGLDFAKVVSIYVNIPQIEMVTTTFRTTSNPFQHNVCQIIKAQKIS